MGDFVGLVAIVMTFSIPLSAILGSYYLKAKKLKANSGLSDKEYQALKAALEKNEELQRRLQNLEIIVEDLNEQVKQLPESNT